MLKIIEKFPNIIQTLYYDCGATALMTVLMYFGIDARLKTLKKETETKKSGTTPERLVEVSRKYGLRAELVESMLSDDLEKSIDEGLPVLISIQIKREPKKDISKIWGTGHFLVVIGYDDNNFYFEDPMFPFITYLSKKELEERWHDSDNYENRKRIKREKYGIIFHPPNNWQIDTQPKHLIDSLTKLVRKS